MHQKIIRAIMIIVPVYVLLVVTTPALAPVVEKVTEFVRKETAPPPPEPVTLSFVGDMMFDRYIREKANKIGYDAIIADSAPLFASSTFVFGNLEGPITTFTPVSDYRDGGPDHYRFTFATTVASTLAQAKFAAVTLGNNHITNFGDEGLEQTKTWLTSAGIGFVGSPDDTLTPFRIGTSSFEIALFAYDPWHTKDVAPLQRIGLEATSTFVVLLAHWGEEYNTIPNANERALAKRFVDAGADLIVGSHPHVIQHKEEYKGVWIYYSLGNFVFDQYFSADVRCGAVLSFTLFPDGSATTNESFIELTQDGTTKRSTCKTSVPVL